MDWTKFSEKDREVAYEKAMSDLMISLDIFDIIIEYAEEIFNFNTNSNFELIRNNRIFIEAYFKGKKIDLDYINAGFIGRHFDEENFIKDYFCMYFATYAGFWLDENMAMKYSDKWKKALEG